MFSEITVIVKDDDRTQKSKFGVYEDYTVSPEDPILRGFIDQAIRDFAAEPSDVIVKISMTVQ